MDFGDMQDARREVVWRKVPEWRGPSTLIFPPRVPPRGSPIPRCNDRWTYRSRVRRTATLAARVARHPDRRLAPARPVARPVSALRTLQPTEQRLHARRSVDRAHRRRQRPDCMARAAQQVRRRGSRGPRALARRPGHVVGDEGALAWRAAWPRPRRRALAVRIRARGRQPVRAVVVYAPPGPGPAPAPGAM